MSLVEGYHLVSVRAFDRAGFDGFCRGGRRWSSKEDTFALVTPALLAVLKAERRMLAVDTGITVDDVPDMALVPRLDLPPRDVDAKAQAIDEARRLKAEIEAEKALAEAAKLRKELEELRAQNAAKPKAKADK